MEKAYNPVSFEGRLYQWWNEKGYFKAEDESSKPSFCIVIPPPNVTGALHNGHALFLTIQDILIRWKRMKGFNTLWLPGTDHAGIATQMVVERDLAKEGKNRHQMGRAAFVEKVWEWKNKHGGLITNQMKVMGASVDWSRERFTMDEGLSHAVREVFVSLYEQGLIYRGSYIINWCHKCQTALSDLEVIPKDRKGHLWHIRYDVVGTSESFVIATTRPETMIGDTAVAVHPEDERYRHLLGKKVRLPLMGRDIPIVGDDYVDREFGTGALKVTPGHDFNDYELGKRHNLPLMTVFSKTGLVNDHGGSVYQGLKISAAREKIVADLESSGHLVKVEDHAHAVGTCERCETIVEPLVSEQWFVKAGVLAKPALEAVRKGEKLSLSETDQRSDAIKILPESWTSTYYNWMENIRDWCISRQLWWGHQIPAWHCGSCHKVSVSRTDLNTCPECKNSNADTFRRDEDVLDTWFSSALWPFSTLGWPEKTKALDTFYPTQILETGTDILFFWVARMIMMGMHFMDGKVPFTRVYLHALVRDEKGQKMSKTKGNVIDPLVVVGEHGADAFRFTLASLSGQGRDIRLSIDRVGVDRAFCNKLWNASRYVLMRLGYVEPPVDEATGNPITGIAPSERIDFRKVTSGLSLEAWIEKHHSEFHPLNQWILSQLQHAISEVEKGFEEFRLNDSAQAMYQFMWGQYCDWYIEYSKELLSNHQERAAETSVCLLYVLEQMLKLSHPIIPFISEEIYQSLPLTEGKTALIVSEFPKFKSHWVDSKADETVSIWCESIERLRAFRGENNISPKARPRVTFEPLSSEFSKHMAVMKQGASFIRAVAQLESFQEESGSLRGQPSSGEVLSKVTKMYIPLHGLVDVAGELKRLEKELATTKADIEFVKKKLGNESFMARAPQELVDEQKKKLEGFELKLVEIEKSRQRLMSLKS